jgi:redox-sensitive bicupin YhaK (pirin superfamily)
MITPRRSADRGHFRSEWLDSYHTFSFDTYFDPDFMGFRTLRVINEDRVKPGMGFPLHPHRDMEILTFILAGALEHRDSLGHRAVISAGEVQRITAGTGIRHSEANPSETEEVHLLQIWILPRVEGLDPGYETRDFTAGGHSGLRLIASPDGSEHSAVIHQDVRLFAGTFDGGERLDYPLSPGRHAWLQITGGEVGVNGTPLREGDGAAISEESALALTIQSKARFLLFDLN